MRQYIAIIHKDPDSDHGVSFPDFPGCITAGRTLEEAREMGEEALRFHVDGLIEDGCPIPEPSTLDVIMADRDNRDGLAIAISLKEAAGRTVLADITMTEDLLARIDAYAESKGMDRSGFLVFAAQRQMGDV